MNDLKHFKFWCYKVLPLVYDDSLSYYEVLDKVVAKLNELIDNYGASGGTIKSMQEAIKELEEWKENFGTTGLDNLIAQYLARMIYMSISDAGYIIYHIPLSWNNVQFNTTGLDISNEELSKDEHFAGYDYGHLVLSY